MQGRATFNLAGGVTAPSRARQIVDITVGAVLPTNRAYQVGLLASEIVSNSVLHGRVSESEDIELALSWNLDRVRLEVTDEGPGFQPPTEPDPDRPGGWGLALVETISDRWGIDRGDRTCVWFELSRETEPGQDAA